MKLIKKNNKTALFTTTSIPYQDEYDTILEGVRYSSRVSEVGKIHDN